MTSFHHCSIGAAPKRLSSALAAIALFALGLALALGLPSSTSATPAPSVFVATNGSDANACTQAAPCKSPNRAYQVASCSSVIQIAAGSYAPADPLLDYDPAKDSCKTPVTFIPSGVVVFGSVEMTGAKHWKFDATTGGSFSFGEIAIWWQSSNTNLPVVDGNFDGGPSRNIHMKAITSATVAPQPKQQFSVLNSEIGPNLGTTEDLIHLRNVRDTIFRGNYIHDLKKPFSDSHSDCIQNMGSSTNLSFIGNEFKNCWSDAFIEKADFGPDINIAFNNNQIDNSINGDGTTPYAVGYFGAGYSVGRVTGEIKNNCILATSNSHIDVDHVSDIDSGTQTVTEGGDNVVVSGNVYGNCFIPLVPDPSVTPGELYAAVRQGTVNRTICKPGWPATIRPSSAYVRRLKVQQMTLYGATGSPSTYVLDHLVPLELGGAPRRAKNLWPEPRSQAKKSDPLERRLKTRVCKRTMTLARAQAAIREFKFVNG